MFGLCCVGAVRHGVTPIDDYAKEAQIGDSRVIHEWRQCLQSEGNAFKVKAREGIAFTRDGTWRLVKITGFANVKIGGRFSQHRYFNHKKWSSWRTNYASFQENSVNCHSGVFQALWLLCKNLDELCEGDGCLSTTQQPTINPTAIPWHNNSRSGDATIINKKMIPDDTNRSEYYW